MPATEPPKAQVEERSIGADSQGASEGEGAVAQIAQAVIAIEEPRQVGSSGAGGAGGANPVDAAGQSRTTHAARETRSARKVKPDKVTTEAEQIASALPPLSEDDSAATRPSEASDLPDWDALLKREIGRLTIGRLLFNPPNVMELGQTERVELRISKNNSEDLAAGLKGRGLPNIESVKVGAFMRAKLAGDDGLRVEPRFDKEEQVVDDTTFSQWAWDVTSLKSGDRALHLTIAVRVKLAGSAEEKKDLPVIDKTIKVKVNAFYAAKSFAHQYWQWLVGTLVLPLFGWGWAQFKNSPRSN